MHLTPSQAAINAARINDLEDRLAYLEERYQELPKLHALQEQNNQVQQQLNSLNRKLQELLDRKSKDVYIYI